MRKILFRGRCVGEDHIYEWVDGYYVCLRDSYKKRETHRIYTGYAESDCGDFYGDWYEVDPKTVGQFTGLYDKNGERIFEGDILKFSSISQYPVFWDSDYQAFGSRYYKDFDYLTSYDMRKIEVVGNIHDNPELME